MSAEIVLHAGMSKTGSTSIQHWLARNVRELSARDIRCVRLTSSAKHRAAAVVPATADNAASEYLGRDRDSRSEMLRLGCDVLGAEAHRIERGTLVLSGEAYEDLFNGGILAEDRSADLGHLNELARYCSVRVAYYVRPQDSWLDSAWRQWGFRSPVAPSAWLRRQEPALDHFRTLTTVRDAAPAVSFEIRPLREDLLDDGEVTSDFGRRFLRLPDLHGFNNSNEQLNRSLPLEATITLRGQSTGRFWNDPHDNTRFYPLKRALRGLQISESPLADRVRSILSRYAFDTFESSNQQLIEALDWPTEYFIMPPTRTAGFPADTLETLDTLLEPSGSAAERSLISVLLDNLLSPARDASAEQGGRAD